MDTLKNVLKEVFEKSPKIKEKAREFEVIEAWPKAVGERIHKHARAIRVLPDGTLVVRAENSAWVHQLHYLQTQIIQKLNKQLGAPRVKQLRFMVGERQSDNNGK
ncbi:MAG: DUF721 domain-containing protein [Bacteriovoracia bacterium]